MQLPGDTGHTTMTAETITVDRKALHTVLQALVGPGHLIRELQHTRSLHKMGHPNPIDTLIEQYEAGGLLPEASHATKGQCNDERACGGCFSGQDPCETAAPAPSVQPADVEAQITHTFYANLGDAENAAWPDPNARDEFHPALNMITTCTLVTKNGHSVVGVAYCADPAKFNAQTGRDAARADAIRQLWPMVIYAERERLAAQPNIALSYAEAQSNYDRVRWAEDLIRQLPADHEGRNSWLLNFGTAAPDLRPAASDDDF